MSNRITENLDPQVMESDPDRLWGAAAFKGTRVHVRTLFDYLADGRTVDDFLADFPSVTRSQATRVIETARDVLVGSVEASAMAAV